MVTNQEIIFALPKGRIQNDVLPIINKLGIEIEPEFFDTKTRKLIFETNKQNLKVIQARSFDIASFVASGKADIGVCGLDVIEEFPNEQIIRIKNLNIGKCRLSLAGKKSDKLSDFSTHIKVATKYPVTTSKLLKQQGFQVETFKLNGAIELASHLGMSDFIVDLVSSGATLKANQLEEKQVLMQIASYLIINKTSYQIKFTNLNELFAEIIK
ncbi:MAG: ATP phosphoribosyltransferase [Rickettsiales bacterium]|nr:ATP phosphoribosyltransferase [Rickettsiales bacterium]